MNLKATKLAAGLLVTSICCTSSAVPPPLDRPSPPPCCADGHCYPNPLTYGWYETRWRRWPLECPAPIPAGQPGAPVPQATDIPIIDLPRPEDEDRRAPPPTAPPAEEQPIRTPPANAPPAAGNQPPAAQPAPPPPVAPGPLAPPTAPSESTSPRRGVPPYEPQSPGLRSPGSTGPTSELDPPPALPFGPSPVDERTPIRETNRGPAMQARQPESNTNVSPSDDPPPALPVTLASWSN